MTKNNILHIFLDFLGMWGLVILGIGLVIHFRDGTWFTIIPLVLFLTPLPFILPRSIRWLRIIFDVARNKPQITYTKGFRFAKREYINYFSKKALYSEVYFDDKTLKKNKEYVYFDLCAFRQGELLEIVYYPKSRYIKSIRRVNNE